MKNQIQIFNQPALNRQGVTQQARQSGPSGKKPLPLSSQLLRALQEAERKNAAIELYWNTEI